ncbi:MAG: TIR domain-containing protein [Pseudodesulfovibrio sp.]|uniref:TIR domain-containing protein n=1 Tax=Pseudodesulfovibrio sp. TaxID=2035812 RepID=UPI003D0CB967
MPDKNVFISHYGRDDEHVGKMKELLQKSGYTLKNSSIDKTKPNQANNEDYIKQLLRDRIRWAGCVTVLIGPYTHTREWVNWEIEQAAKQGTRIVGVYINGASDSDVPEAFEKYGDALVGWSSEKIIGAIEGYINNWETVDGGRRESKWSINREVC